MKRRRRGRWVPAGRMGACSRKHRSWRRNWRMVVLGPNMLRDEELVLHEHWEKT